MKLANKHFIIKLFSVESVNVEQLIHAFFQCILSDCKIVKPLMIWKGAYTSYVFWVDFKIEEGYLFISLMVFKKGNFAVTWSKATEIKIC